MSLRTQAAKRRNSYIEIEGNPLETGVVPEGLQLKVENLSDAKPIEEEDLKNMVKYVKAQGDNEKKVKAVDETKNAFLFSSEDMLQILDTTPSVKTRIRIIGLIGPRLTDPKAKVAEILGLFRYAEEKNQVEEILKHRAHTVANNVYVAKPAAAGPGRGGGGRGGMVLGGRGGRGRGGRGTRSTSPVPSTSIAAPESEKVSPVSPRRATSPVPFGGPKGSNPLETKMRSPRESPRASSPEEEEEEMAGSRAPFSSIGAGPVSADKQSSASDDVAPVTATPDPVAPVEPTEEAAVPVASVPSEDIEAATSATIMDELATAPDSTAPEASVNTTPVAENGTPDVQKFDSIDVEVASASSSTSLALQIDGVPTPSVLPLHRPARRSSVSDSVLRSLGLSEETLDEAPEESWVEKYEKKRLSQNAVEMQEDTNDSTENDANNGQVSDEQVQPTGVPHVTEEEEINSERPAEGTVEKDDSQADAPVTPRKESADDAEAPATGLRAWFRRISFSKTPANTPAAPAPAPDASALDRQPRSSLQKLQEEKKVGMIRRLFERKVESPEPKPDPRRENPASDVRKSQLFSMPCEGPIGKDDCGRELYSYHELVRRNTTKDFRGINPNELELYLSDEEFIMRFNSTKEEFSELPKWRRTERKKALLLF